jgi:hypothetical protein
MVLGMIFISEPTGEKNLPGCRIGVFEVVELFG